MRQLDSVWKLGKKYSNKKTFILLLVVLFFFFIIFNRSYSSPIPQIHSRSKRLPYNEKLNIYNSIVKLWSQSGREYFKNRNLRLIVDNEEYSLKSSKTQKNSWPENDFCSSSESPSQCLSYKPLSYISKKVKVGKNSLVTLMDEDEVVFKQRIKSTGYIPFEYCTPYSKECKRCNLAHGIWNGTYCNIPQYIGNVCFRLREDERGHLHLDSKDREGGLFPYLDVGCDHNLSPYMYSSSKNKPVTFSFRYYLDPYIASNYLTSDCPRHTDSDSIDQNCFNIPKHGKVNDPIIFRPFTALFYVLFAIGRLLKSIVIGILICFIIIILVGLFFGTGYIISGLNGLRTILAFLQERFPRFSRFFGSMHRAISNITNSYNEDQNSEEAQSILHSDSLSHTRSMGSRNIVNTESSDASLLRSNTSASTVHPEEEKPVNV